MKSVRILLSGLSVILFSSLGIAGNIPTSIKPESTQIQAYLSGLNFKEYLTEPTKVNVSFFINGKNEIVVVSTNNSLLDEMLKDNLNYKTLKVNELKYNTLYTLPIVIN